MPPRKLRLLAQGHVEVLDAGAIKHATLRMIMLTVASDRKAVPRLLRNSTASRKCSDDSAGVVRCKEIVHNNGKERALAAFFSLRIRDKRRCPHEREDIVSSLPGSKLRRMRKP